MEPEYHFSIPELETGQIARLSMAIEILSDRQSLKTFGRNPVNPTDNVKAECQIVKGGGRTKFKIRTVKRSGGTFYIFEHVDNRINSANIDLIDMTIFVFPFACL